MCKTHLVKSTQHLHNPGKDLILVEVTTGRVEPDSLEGSDLGDGGDESSRAGNTGADGGGDGGTGHAGGSEGSGAEHVGFLGIKSGCRDEVRQLRGVEVWWPKMSDATRWFSGTRLLRVVVVDFWARWLAGITGAGDDDDKFLAYHHRATTAAGRGKRVRAAKLARSSSV